MPQPFKPITQNVSPAIARRLEQARDSATANEGLTLAEMAFADAVSPLEQAAAGHSLIYFAFRSGAVDRVVRLGSQVLPLLKGHALIPGYVEALRLVGISACEVGKFDIAIAHATEGTLLAQTLNDPRAHVMALSLLGACCERSGDPWQSERILRDALQIARSLDDPHPLVTTLNNLGAALIGKFYLLRDSNEADQARDALQASLPLAREVLEKAPLMNDRLFVAYAHGNLGELLVHAGQLADARQHLEAALAIAKRESFQAVICRVTCSFGELLLAEGDPQGARDILVQLTSSKVELLSISTQLRARYALYLSCRAMGDSTMALAELEASRRIEIQRTVEQLHARSALLVTRVEAAASQRQGLELA